MTGFATYVAKKLLDSIPTLVGVTVVVFVVLLVMPGNPAQLIQGEMADPAVTAALVEKWGLDQPAPIRYVRWVSSLARLDLGRSLVSGTPVVERLGRALLFSTYLGLTSILIAIVVSLPLGILFALRKNSATDQLGMLVALIGISTPGFVTGLLLQLVFGRYLGLLPMSGHRGAILSLESLSYLLLPALAAAFILIAIDTRVVRASLLEVLHLDYVTTARAKGLSYLMAVAKHAVPNAIIPVITMFGLHFTRLFAGLLVIEIVFGWPGVGRLFYEAVLARDYPIIQAASLVIALGVIVVNTSVDLLYAVADPRIRLEA